jgi:flagellar hook-basal body complex protein FliE
VLKVQIDPLSLLLPKANNDNSPTVAGSAAPGESFGRMLNKAIQDVNNAQLEANQAVKGFLTGEIQDVHQVAIAMEQAKIMLMLATESRNKVIEAYQEISRMQV